VYDRESYDRESENASLLHWKCSESKNSRSPRNEKLSEVRSTESRNSHSLVQVQIRNFQFEFVQRDIGGSGFLDSVDLGCEYVWWIPLKILHLWFHWKRYTNLSYIWTYQRCIDLYVLYICAHAWIYHRNMSLYICVYMYNFIYIGIFLHIYTSQHADRVAKTHRMPYLYAPFSTKEPCN